MSGVVSYVGILGFLLIGLFVGLAPEPEIIPNPVLLLNIWTIIGIIIYLLCWPIAFYQLLSLKSIKGITDLGMVSALYCVTFLLYSYNPFIIAIIFIILLYFLLYIQSPASYFRRYYIIEER